MPKLHELVSKLSISGKSALGEKGLTGTISDAHMVWFAVTRIAEEHPEEYNVSRPQYLDNNLERPGFYIQISLQGLIGELWPNIPTAEDDTRNKGRIMQLLRARKNIHLIRR